MMPDNELSTTSIAASFLVPSRYDNLIDYERGGVDFYDASHGLDVKLWQSKYENDEIIIFSDDVSYSVLTAENVTEISFAFDFNMRPIVAYVADDIAYFYWYNSTTQENELIKYGEDYITPQLALDIHYQIQDDYADVIFAYIRDGILRTRLQRDRFEIEYTHREFDKLVQIGMMRNNRFGFAAKSINVYDYNYDLAIISPHNKTELRLNYLDLITELPQPTSLGDNIIAAYGAEFNSYARGKKNLVHTTEISFLLDDSEYNYFMCFYRVWQHNLKPFYMELVLEKREPELHKCHFVPDSVSMSTVGNMFRITATLSLIDKNRNKADYKELARSRN